MVPLAVDDGRQIAPAVGEHGREVLRERGYDDKTIDDLIGDAALFVNA
jgi:crotonobetainyl-CoA:carnitine CoA-transferase CaiB-like acyl-CoA transferase